MKVENIDLYQDDGCLDHMLYRQQLPDVFNIDLDLFPKANYMNVTGKHINLYDLFQKIKYNLVEDSKNDYKKDYDADIFLTDKYIDGKRNSVYDSKKVNYPLVAYNATFHTRKEIADVKTITNLMYLDIDCFKTKQQALEYKEEIINKYDWILACYRSLSKIGLHVIINVDKIHGNNDYNDKYEYISKEYFEDKLDKGAKSISRFTIIPYDFNIFINEQPNILHIEQIIQEHKKGLRSAYNCNTTSSDSGSQKGTSSAYNCQDSSQISSNQKGLRSVHKENASPNCKEEEKGLRSVHKEEEEVICTAYTFLHDNSLDQILNIAAREKGLRFRVELDEAIFEDVDIPMYYYEGVDVMEVNLHPFKNSKLESKGSGSRNFFLGALTIKMIYLNIESSDHIDQKIRKAILKFILNVNNKICDPPLPKNTVIKSFNANFKKYQAGELNFKPYLIKQRAFWSKNTTLKGNAKRKVTCEIKNRPIVEESKKKIYEAIEILAGGNFKITQEQVKRVSGLSISTVKKYWKEFKEVVKTNNQLLKKDTEMKTEIHEPQEEDDFDDDCLDVGKDILENTKNLLNPDPDKKTEENQSLTQEQLTSVFNRIYINHLKRLDAELSKQLLTAFKSEILSYTPEEQQLLLLDIEDVDEKNFWKHGNLETKLFELLMK
jgi:hypothetical protein